MRAIKKQKCKSNFQTALKYIHKVEIKYGSVAKTPEDDPDLKKARKILNVKSDIYDTDIDLKIKELIEYGYSAGAIYQVLNVNQSKVQKIREFYKLKFKPIFKYQLSKGNYTGYTPYVKGMCKIAQIGTTGNSNNIIEKIQRRGYTIRHVALYWGDLPNGAVYATRDSRLMQKHGNNSYLKDEYKKQIESDESMQIIISADIYDKLQKYSKNVNEPMSYIATIAIKKYLDF